jgi:hypothetical protein
MTLAEILLVLLVLYAFYRLLGPVQQKIERAMLHFFGGGKKRPKNADIIDITHYKNDNEDRNN